MTNDSNQTTADAAGGDSQATGTNEAAGANESTATDAGQSQVGTTNQSGATSGGDASQSDPADQSGGDAGGTANDANQEQGQTAETVVTGSATGINQEEPFLPDTFDPEDEAGDVEAEADTRVAPDPVKVKSRIRDELAFACGIRTGNAWAKYRDMSTELQQRVCEIIGSGGPTKNGDLRQCMVQHEANINRAAAEANKAVVDGVNDAD